MKITIKKSFLHNIHREAASPGAIAGRVVLPASCEALIIKGIVTLSHPYGDVTITVNRFQELIQDESIRVDEN